MIKDSSAGSACDYLPSDEIDAPVWIGDADRVDRGGLVGFV